MESFSFSFSCGKELCLLKYSTLAAMPLRTRNALFQALLSFKVFIGKAAAILMAFPVVCNCIFFFFLSQFSIYFSLLYILSVLNMVGPGGFLWWPCLLGVVSFHQLLSSPSTVEQWGLRFQEEPT